jgi:hypothetical protein
MARTAAIIGALWTAVRRDGETLGSFTGNNFFLISIVFLFFGDPGAFVWLNFILALVLFFPLSTDPLAKIPRARLALWPIEASERRLLRIMSPWLNPMTWLLAILVLRRSISLGLWALLAALFAIGFAVPSIPWARHKTAWRMLPHFPGPLNQLIRKNLRELLSTLDFYCALLLCASTVAYRAFSKPFPSEAGLVMTVLVVLALSTYTQCLFGLDGAGGLSRYRLLPLRGWQLLAAKDAAFLLAAIALTLPLAPLAGTAAALVALAAGRAPSVEQPHSQVRWRFSASGSLARALVQTILLAMAASAVFFSGAWAVLPCLAAWASSLWWYGRRMDAPFSGD